MLEKIISIRAIGRFTDCVGQGDTLFRRLTLVYGENGRGKTTLCDILRSLANGDADLIKGRTSLGTSDKPLVKLRAAGNGYTFKDGTWDSTFADLCVFDKTFIHNNVYTGDLIEHEHKRNLYQVIIGERGTHLARRIESIDGEVRQLNKDIASSKTAIEAVLPKHLKLEAFLGLPVLDEPEKAIKEKELELASLSRSDEIARKASLQEITLPSLPPDVKPVLGRTLDDLSKESEKLVRQHVDRSLGNGGEQWIAQGLGYGHDDDCPYCGQNTKGLSLLDAFRAFFGEGYKSLKDDVSKAKEGIERALGEGAVIGLQETLTSNATLTEFWKQFADVSDAVVVTFDAIAPAIRQLRDAALKAIETKAGAILEPCSQDAITESEASVASLEKSVASYNAFIVALNLRIAEQKRLAGSGNVLAATTELASLKARQKRHESPTTENCQRYSEQLASKKLLESEKDTAKKKLDEFGNTVCVEYEQRINELLERFHAGFRICDTTRRYVGGTASSSYQIAINNIPVDLGDSKTPASKPSFQNTLSGGDRSTLAFAFFVAQVERDPRLSEKVIVFDDPFTSQDRSRRTHTQQIINRLATTAMQVVVLSHDASFLRDVWDADYTEDVKTLQFVRLCGSTMLSEWNIVDETMGDFHRMHGLLSLYFSEGRGDKRHVAQTVRPFMEHWLKNKFPGQVRDGEMLGAFISSVRNADSSSPLAPARAILEDLEDINGFSKRYHHADNPRASSEPIDDTELSSFVKRTLDLAAG